MGFFQRVKSILGFGGVELPAPTGSRTLVKAVAEELPLWKQFQRIGGAVTPEQFSGYLRAADGGHIGQLVSFAMESRQKDGHLQGILGAREDAIQDLEWEWYYPGQDPESSSGQRQIRFLEEQTANNPEFAKLIAHISGDFFPGFSATEIIRRKDGGRTVLDRAVPIDTRRCGFAGRDGKLIFRDDPSTIDEYRFEDFEPGKFVVTKRRMNGDVEAREGLMRVLLWCALFRNWSLSDWLKLAEIAWKPYRVVKYQKDSLGAEDRADLEAMLDRLASSGVLMMPDSVELEVMWPQGSQSSAGQSNHSSLHQVMGREMSKAVLGQDGTTEQNATGGFAQVKVQERVSDKKLTADARNASFWVTEHFAKPSIAMNFGETAKVPHFRLKIARPVDLTKVSNAISVLATAGLRIPATWARQQIGAPTPKPDEELVTDGKPEPVAPGATPAADGEDAQDAKDDADQEPT